MASRAFGVRASSSFASHSNSLVACFKEAVRRQSVTFVRREAYSGLRAEVGAGGRLGPARSVAPPLLLKGILRSEAKSLVSEVSSGKEALQRRNPTPNKVTSATTIMAVFSRRRWNGTPFGW